MAYTTINDPTDYFNTVLYTGNNTYPRTIDGFGFQPDFVWAKPRSVAYGHMLFDVIRGVGNTNFLDTRLSDAEGTSSVNANIDSFDSDGYIIDSPSSTDTQNASGLTMATWGWKAGGTGVSNTDGSITSTVSANTTSGFSIVTYTGTGSAGTVGHGLNNAPEMIILKRRDGGSGNTNWFVGHKDLTSWGYRIFLNVNLAEAADSDFLANTAPTSNHFSVSTDISTNGSSGSQLAYCFHSVKGFSKIGSYTGNGSTDGTFVYTGFKPAWVMVKRTNTTGSWIIFDNKRNTFNPEDKFLYPNLNNAEGTLTALDFVSNGFKFRNADTFWNASGSTYIFMAFAESPFTTSTGVPITAR